MPLRVLHISPFGDASYGGPASTLQGLVNAQLSAGDRVGIATLKLAGGAHDITGALAARGADVFMLGEGRGPLLASPGISAIKSLVTDYDIVHVHGVWEDLVARGLEAAHAARRPSVLRPCGMLTAWSLARHPLRKRVVWNVRARRTAALARAVHFASAQEAAETAWLPVGSQSTFIEPNGIDVASLGGGDGTRFRRRHEIPLDQPIILFLSRLHPGKGLEALIPAFSHATSNHLLVLAGPGDESYVRGLRAIADQAGVAQRVRFTGMIGPKERNDALQAAELFILPSDHESFGNAALEALAAGVPAIVSDRVPLAHAITEARCGLVCAPRTDAIADALREWLGTRASDAEAGARARFCAAAFDWPVVASRIRSRYEALIAGAL